ncbi:MAG: cytochrome c [Candidatus Solibacter usitatus]|nr:cytochrome c [Candidatus Solibacter usitatus]
MQTRRTAQLLLIAAAGLILGACSNFPSRQTPIWVWDDMKKQDKYKAQMSSAFFADGRASRRPVEGALAQEHYRADEAYFTGVADGGLYVARNPEPLTREVLLRGQNKFNVYCSPCHDRTGSGRGIVPAKATWIPGNMHDERVVNFVDGEIFHVITMGRRSMPGYRFQIQEKDRWAIVAYVRALQRAGRGSMADVPAGLQAKVR